MSPAKKLSPIFILLPLMLSSCQALTIFQKNSVQEMVQSQAFDSESEAQKSSSNELIADESSQDPLNNTDTSSKIIPNLDEQSEIIQDALLQSLSAEVSNDDSTQDDINLLDLIAQGFELPVTENEDVKSQINWYVSHPKYLERTFNRGQPFLYFIMQEVQKRNLPLELVLLPIVESAFDPFAYSHGRASGIWQFIPSTGKLYGLKQNWWYDGRRDIEAATHAALNYLTQLNKQFNGNWFLALAAYNSGEGNVARAIKYNKSKGKPTDFWSLNLPRETQAYVPKLLALAQILKNLAKYQIELPFIAYEPFLDKVEVGSQIDLALAADLSELSMNDIYRYNAAYNRWATDPDGPHSLFIPVDNAQIFRDKLQNLPPQARIKWARYTVKSGDTLSEISRSFHTTEALIASANDLPNNMIKIGQKLMIPSAQQKLNQYSLSESSRLKTIISKNHHGIKTEYKVKEGDSLWDISRQFKVNVRSLAKWNGMAPRDSLSVGKKLVVWSKSPATHVENGRPNTLRKLSYKVRSGDSIARISQKFKVNIKELMQWNKLDPSKYLKPGQFITLFVDVTRQSGI